MSKEATVILGKTAFGPHKLRVSDAFERDMACHGDDIIWDQYVRANIRFAQASSDANYFQREKAWKAVCKRHRRSYTKFGQFLNQINERLAWRKERRRKRQVFPLKRENLAT